MASVAETLNSKPPLGAALAEGVRTLSADQILNFSLYQRYVFPLDGLNYWIKIPTSPLPVQTPGILAQPGLVTSTVKPKEAIQVVAGSLAAMSIVGGTIINPLDAIDQGLAMAESLFIDITGPAYSEATVTTKELKPGDSFTIPAYCTSGVWVCSLSGGHKFTCIVQVSHSSVLLPTDVEVKGSFHYDSSVDQREDATVDSNTVIFTSLSEIQPFNMVGPDHLYICHYRDLTFAFSSRGRLYEQADLYHYLGKALFSVNATQIIDDPTHFNPQLVVSNSLPIWLNMQNYVPPYPGFICPVPVYPSYLVDDNLLPPFASIHIDDSIALAQCPSMGPMWEADQLCRDRVRIHIYGANNAVMSTLRDFIEQYSLDQGYFGIAMSGAIRDDKHIQPEFKIVAQRKFIEFEVNYYQSTSRNMAQQYIKGAKVQWTPPQFLQP